MCVSLIVGSALLAMVGPAVAQNVQAIKARQEARTAQNANLAAAQAAANKSTGSTTSNVGDVSLQSEEDLQDESIRSKSTKNRLRVDRTGLSVGGTATAGTGLSI